MNTCKHCKGTGNGYNTNCLYCWGMSDEQIINMKRHCVYCAFLELVIAGTCDCPFESQHRRELLSKVTP